ncbi:MAG: hypothetical protein OXH70_15760 [Acidobacteria bacterium]|nr:hypothetical protein [Acidobacteriota bacterium]
MLGGAALVLGMGLALAPVAAGQSANAEESEPEGVSYTYLSLEYEASNTHHGSDGLTLGFCFEIAEPFHLFGGYQVTTIDLGDVAPFVEGDRKGYLVGAGVKQRIGKRMTAQYRLGYLDSETEIGAPGFGVLATDKSDGHYVEAGIRTLPWPSWELDGFVAHFSLGDFDNNMLFITLERRVTRNLGINLSYRKTEGDNPSDSWIWAVRYHM